MTTLCGCQSRGVTELQRELLLPKMNECGDGTGRAVEGASPYQSKIMKMSQQVKLPFISVGVDALGDPKTNVCGDGTGDKFTHFSLRIVGTGVLDGPKT